MTLMITEEQKSCLLIGWFAAEKSVHQHSKLKSLGELRGPAGQGRGHLQPMSLSVCAEIFVRDAQLHKMLPANPHIIFPSHLDLVGKGQGGESGQAAQEQLCQVCNINCTTLLLPLLLLLLLLSTWGRCCRISLHTATVHPNTSKHTQLDTSHS